MTALKITDGGSPGRSRPGEHASARLASELPAVGATPNRSNNGAGVLPVRLAGRSLPAAPIRTCGRSSTSGESHGRTGEPGRCVAHVAPATPSHKTNAAGRPGPAALTPSQIDPTKEH